MAKIYRTDPEVTITLTIQLNEAEMNALDALTGYGEDPFLKVFYKYLGQAYMKPHEAGLRSFFKTIRDNVPRILSQTQEARIRLNEVKR